MSGMLSKVDVRNTMIQQDATTVKYSICKTSGVFSEVINVVCGNQGKNGLDYWNWSTRVTLCHTQWLL